MVVAAIFAGVITLFCQIVYRSIVWGGVWGGGRGRRGNFGLFLLIAVVVGAIGYLLAIVIRMAISRTREYVADAGSVELTHNPDAMISALAEGRRPYPLPSSARSRCGRDVTWRTTTRGSWAFFADPPAASGEAHRRSSQYCRRPGEANPALPHLRPAALAARSRRERLARGWPQGHDPPPPWLQEAAAVAKLSANNDRV